MIRYFSTCLLSISTCLLLPSVNADEPPYPADMPILTVFDQRGTTLRELTLEDLETMPGHEVSGPIPDNGDPESRWYGVSLKALLEGLHIPLPDQVLASALNGYDEIIPKTDLLQYDPIVAYRRNGHYLPVDAYGPLMTMYPYATHPELYTRTYYNRSVWQLNELHLR